MFLRQSVTRGDSAGAAIPLARVFAVLATVLLTLAVSLMAASSASAAFGYTGQFGSYGSGDGQLKIPQGITLGSDGYVYVADLNNYRFQRFTAAGGYDHQGGIESDGTPGLGELSGPVAAVLANGSVWVLDRWDQRIVKFAPNGTAQSGGFTVGINSDPRGLAIDAARDRVYVSDDEFGNPKIKVFTMAGSDAPVDITGFSLTNPAGLALGAGGAIYIADRGASNIKVFTAPATSSTAYAAPQVVSGPGQSVGSLSAAEAVSVDGDGGIWVADTGRNRIQKFTSAGVSAGAWGNADGGSDQGAFDAPVGIAATGTGTDVKVYVSDTYNDRVQIFSNAAVAPSNVAAPAISGTPTPGSYLECSDGTWAGDPVITLGYSWLRNGAAVGAGSEYLVNTADVGAAFVCRVTATNSVGSVSADSAAVTITSGGTNPLVTNQPVTNPPLSNPPVAVPDTTAKIGYRVYRQNLKKVIAKGMYMFCGLGETGSVKVRVLIDKTNQKNMGVKLAGGVAAAKVYALGDSSGWGGYLRFNAKGLKGLKTALKHRKNIKVTVEISGSDSRGNKAATVKKAYTLKTGASA